MSECQVLTSLFLDQIHPTLVGELLIADLLVNYLAGAEDYFSQQPGGGSTKLIPGAAATGSEGASFRKKHNLTVAHSQQVTRHLPLPMHASSLIVPVMRCFGTNGAHSDSPEGFHPSETMRVVKSDGWQLVREENGKFKPGWVSTVPGSVLRILMTTKGVRQAGPSRGVWQQQQQEDLVMGVTFLRSYEHMGVAEVSCVTGCLCRNYSFDGHEPNHHHSVPFTVDTAGTLMPQSHSCIVQVRGLAIHGALRINCVVENVGLEPR
jgi:hypothetical protein